MRDTDSTEAISALMDGEAEDADALDVLIQNGSLRRTWGRYHMISDCLGGRLPAQLDRRLADRVAAAIRSEPAIVAPAPERAPRQLLRPLAGLAIAASVAAVAILGVQQQRADDTGVSPAVPVAAVTAPEKAPAAQQRQFTLASGGTTVAPPQARPAAGGINPRLNRYLVNYNEYRRNAAVQGMLPYVRIVAQDDMQ
jgi:sigma-E factor negative regulatory protein RseA